MQVDAFLLRVVEEDAPLIELGDVVVEFVVPIDERPHVVAVPTRVVGDERHRVRPFGGHVIHDADQSFAFSILPRRIAGLPILDVRRVRMERHLRLARDGAVEIRVREQGFRRIGANFQEVLAVALKLQIMLARILQSAASTKVRRPLVC